jgi:hypothetical protein
VKRKRNSITDEREGRIKQELFLGLGCSSQKCRGRSQKKKGADDRGRGEVSG